MKKKAIFFALILIVLSLPLFSGCGKKDGERTTYNITCALDGYVLKGTETVDFFNSSPNVVGVLKFNIFGNAFREGAKYSPISAQYISRAYPNGLSYGSMSIKSVTENGKALSYSVGGEDENVLSVMLGREIFPDERACVTIEYELKLANVVARTGYNANTVNLANFYPILCGMNEDGSFYECVYYSSGDPFFSDCADYKVSFTSEAKYNVAASSKVQSATQNGKLITRCYDMKKTRSFALVLSEKFESVTDNSLGVEINYYYYSDTDPKASLTFAVQSMKLFTEKFGEYPYSTYSVVQTEFVQGGMEFPGLVMISDDLEGLPYGEVIVHETAHQWWQSAVGNNEIEYGFLDEGLAEYSVVIFYENYPQYGFDRQNLITASEQTYKVYCSVYEKVFGGVNTVMMRSLKDFTSEYEYVNIAYVKPCIMYDYLRESIGDELFFKALKRYYEEYKFKNAIPDDLVAVYEKVGADTNGFFKSFFDGKVII